MTTTVLREVEGYQLIHIVGMGLAFAHGDDRTSEGYVKSSDAARLSFVHPDTFMDEAEMLLEEWRAQSEVCDTCGAYCDGDYTDGEFVYCSQECKEQASFSPEFEWGTIY